MPALALWLAGAILAVARVGYPGPKTTRVPTSVARLFALVPMAI